MRIREALYVTMQGILLIAASGTIRAAHAASIAITEWMYNGDGFVEFANLSSSAIDFVGWSFDDSSCTAGSTSLSAFGCVAPGESVILSEVSASTFGSTWNLPPAVKIIGNNTQNLGRGDEINVFDADGILVDRLTYDDQLYTGTIRTQNMNGNSANLAVLDLDTLTSDRVLSSVGDSYGSHAASAFLGNPGVFAPTAAPVPATLPIMLSAFAGFVVFRRRET